MGDLYGLKHQSDMPRYEVKRLSIRPPQAFALLCEVLSSSSINIISYFSQKVKSFSASSHSGSSNVIDSDVTAAIYTTIAALRCRAETGEYQLLFLSLRDPVHAQQWPAPNH